MDNNLIQIAPGAKIAANVKIEPFVTIAGDVEIGEGTWIGSNVCIMDGVRIGKNCKIHPGAILGGIPQDLKFKGEKSILDIKDNVTIREYCTINRGTEANYATTIGENTLIMAYVHVAHDCILGKNVIISNSSNLAGHIEVGDHAILGGMTAVHQFVKIGAHAFIGGGSLVRKDIPPFVKAAREPIAFAGVNSVGLRRRGFTHEQIQDIQNIYRILFVKGYNTSQALSTISTTFTATPERDLVLDFIKKADRGIMKGFRQINSSRKNGVTAR